MSSCRATNAKVGQLGQEGIESITGAAREILDEIALGSPGGWPMNAPRIIPARPMPLDAILPLIREVGSLRERGEYGAAAELEAAIRQPLTVAGRVLEPTGGDHEARWYHSDISLMASMDTWRAVLTMHGTLDTAISVQTQGRGPTIAAALADAQERYRAAIADTLLRMGGLLREVVL